MVGIVQAGAGIGGFIFPPLTSWLILDYGWRDAYWFMGILTFFLMIICGLFIRSDPREVGQSGEGGEWQERPSRKPQEKGQSSNPNRIWGLLSRSPFWMLLGVYGSFGFCRATFLAHIAAHTQDLGFTLADGAFVTALISGASIGGRLGTGSLLDRLGNRAALAGSFGITTIAILVVLAADNLWMLYFFGLAFGFAWGAQAVLRFTAATEVFGLHSLGILLGLFSFVEAMAAMLGSYLGGYIFDLFGSYGPIFWAGALIAAMGSLLSLFLRARPRTS